MLEQLILVIHALAAVAIIALILIQHGKGADMGASFGSGASQTVLGVQGGGNMLTRSTAILVAVFFLTSLSLAYYAKQRSGMVENNDVEAVIETPVEGSSQGGVANEEIPALIESDNNSVDVVNEVPSENEAGGVK